MLGQWRSTLRAWKKQTCVTLLAHFPDQVQAETVPDASRGSMGCTGPETLQVLLHGAATHSNKRATSCTSSNGVFFLAINLFSYDCQMRRLAKLSGLKSKFCTIFPLKPWRGASFGSQALSASTTETCEPSTQQLGLASSNDVLRVYTEPMSTQTATSQFGHVMIQDQLFTTVRL